MANWIKRRYVFLILACIVVIGAFLRFYNIGGESLWYDEAASVYNAKLPFLGSLKDSLFWRRQPPLHFFLLRLWMVIFGDREVAVRALSAIFGIAVIPMMFFVGRNLLNQRVGLTASFLAAISYFSIRYSQECRDYIMMVFFALLSFYFFITILKSSTKNKWTYLFFGISNILLICSHYFGLFVVASQVFYFLLVRKRVAVHEKLFWYSILGVAIAYLPWAVAVVIYTIPNSFSFGKPDFTSLISTLRLYSGYDNVGNWLLPIFGLLFLIGIFTCHNMNLGKSEDFLKSGLKYYRWKISWGVLLLVIWFLFPIVIPFLIAQIPASLTGIYLAKYTLGAMPAFYLLVAAGIAKFTFNKYLYPVFIIILLAVVVLSGIGLQKYYTVIEKDQWRETVDYMMPQVEETDVIVLSESYFWISMNYYSHHKLDTMGIRHGEEAAKLSEFVAEGKSRMWLVQGPWGSTTTMGYMMQTYGEDRVILEKHFYRIDIYLFDLTKVIPTGNR